MLNEICELIKTEIPQANPQVLTAEVGDSSILVEADHIFMVCELLRDNQKYPFNALQVISGVDYTEYFEVNYMLANFDVNAPHNLILKVRVKDRVNPEVDSVVKVWAAANWQERECYDMLGITFRNHPDHRRILCPDDWEGFPLRKDYMPPKMYNEMEIYPDHKMNLEDREFIIRQKEIRSSQEAASE